jgi:hypothetical protein
MQILSKLRDRYVISARLLLLMTANSLVGGFVLGYGSAFVMWWNR